MYFKLAGLVLALLFALPILAEDILSTGVALAADNKPIPNAKVTYKSKDGKIVATATTDGQGAFQVTVAGGQDYDVTVEAEGLAPLVKAVAKSALEKLGKLVLPAKPKAPAPALEEASGLVLDNERKPIAKAKVTLKSGENQTTTVLTNEKGEFVAKLPNETSYDIKVEAIGYSPVTLQMKKEGLLLVQVVLAKSGADCCQPAKTGPWILLICLTLYCLVAFVARYYNISKIDQQIILAILHSLTQEAETTAASTVKTRIDALITKAKASLEKADGWRTFLFGFRGEAIAARINVCDARLILAETYTRDQLLSGLRTVIESLRPEYSNIALKVEATLTTVTNDEPSTDFLRATYISALNFSHQKAERAFVAVTNWQNKAFALIFLGSGLLGALAIALDNQVLVFLGLLGGFASRLMRGKTTASSDGSLTWTTILLSPLYGGFAGWAGILILSGAKELKLVGDLFRTVEWEQASCSSLALGLAFLFGFSERFFSAVTDMAENAITKQKNASAADSPDTKPTPSDPKAGIPTATAGAAAVIGSGVLASDTRTVTLTGTNLKAVKEVRLKGLPTALTITAQTDTQIVANAPNQLAKGIYAILINGTETAKSIDVP